MTYRRAVTTAPPGSNAGSRRAAAIVALACSCAATTAPSHAAHPSLTEDAGTQGARRVELEVGTTFAHGPDGRLRSVEPQLSIGVTEQLDAIVLPTFVAIDAADLRVRGAGATTTDIKWRFLELEDLDFALRAGVDWPTGSNALGGDRSSLHALLVATRRIGDTTVSFNAGVDRQSPAFGERRLVARLALGIVHPVHEVLTLVGDLAIQSNPAVAQSTAPGVASVGLIARIAPTTFVDVGYRLALNDVARPHAVAAGITFHW